jgi:multiple sugar transport system permease protein
MSKRADHLGGWILAGPATLGLALFLLLPFLLAVGMSFTNYRLNSPLPVRWQGLDNYADLVTDRSLRRALLNNLLFVGIVVPVQTALALGMALLVNRPLRGMATFRTLFFMPVVYPMALVAVVWRLIFAPGETGPLNALLHAASFGAWDAQTDFLREEALALPSIMVMSIWQGAGFQMVVMLAGLQAIPASLYESAQIDGAGPWARFRHVTLPQMRNTILYGVMVTTILAFRLFDQVFILTKGGPNDATTTLLYEAYVASRERNQIGLGSAVSVVLFLVVVLVAMAQHFLVRQEREGAT